jgi:putative FmdB family regulatory protein
MPIYEYRCTACGHQLEVMQKMSERPLRKCSKCGGRLEKLISRAAFQLRGGGWYSEGYAKDSDNKKKTSKSESSDSPSAGSKSKVGDSSSDPSPKKKTAAG